MIRIAFAVAIATLALTTASEISQAAPIAPLPTGVASEAASGNVTQVWCGWRCRHWASLASSLLVAPRLPALLVVVLPFRGGTCVGASRAVFSQCDSFWRAPATIR